MNCTGRDGSFALYQAALFQNMQEHTLNEMQHFFENNKKLKKKPVEILVHGFNPRAEALAAVNRSIELYKAKFSK